jgi:hypothetical protein
MIRPRWGTFSVRDHLKEQAFVSELLLYDRLVVPVPPPQNEIEWQRWAGKKWDPDRQAQLLEILGKDLSVRLPWTEELRKQHRSHLEKTRKVDEAVQYGLTTIMAAGVPFEAYDDLVLPPSEPKPYVLPAYPTPAALLKAIPLGRLPLTPNGRRRVPPEEERDLAITVMREILMPRDVLKPRGVRLGTELLRDTAALVRDDEYKRNRIEFYEWEEHELIRGHSTAESIERMRHLLNRHEQIVRQAWKDVRWKRVFTVLAVGGTLGSVLGAAAATAWFAQATAAQLIAPASGTLGVTAVLGRFLKFDRKPSVQPGETAPAAMIATIRRELALE